MAYRKSTSKRAKKVTIPSSITIQGKKYRVTSIGKKAFKGKEDWGLCLSGLYELAIYRSEDEPLTVGNGRKECICRWISESKGQDGKENVEEVCRYLCTAPVLAFLIK